MTIEYTYDPEAADHADDNANRLDTSGAYKGIFRKAEAITAQSGTDGIRFFFVAEKDQGEATVDLYTQRDDGTKVFGFNLVSAIMGLLKVKQLSSVPGPVSRYSEEEKKMVDVDGEVFPDLCNKRIGVVLQKELTTKSKGGDGFRMNLANVYDADTDLTWTELKEGKKEPTKLKRICRSLKDKDSRKARHAEPGMDTGGASLPEGF